MKQFLKTYQFSLILLGSMILGGIIGAVWGEGALVLKPVADTFINLLYCSVVPLIFVSLVSSISSTKNVKKLGKILIVMLIIYLLSGAFASIFMIGVSAIFDPAQGADIVMNKTVDDLAVNANILEMFTVSDFTLLWSRNNLMALIIAAILFGISLISIGEKGKPVVTFFKALSEVILKLISIVMYAAPIGLGCFFAMLIGEHGKAIAGPLSRALIVFLFASIVYFVLSNTLFAFIGGGRLGIRKFWRTSVTPALSALGTCSSAACIPANLIAAKDIGISDEVADITIPMGANLHKDGACLITILKIAFMCSVFNINLFTPSNMITAVVISVVASTVMGAIPSGGFVGEIFILSAFGFPSISVPIMVLIGTITDAPATAINVTGDTGAAMIVERFIEGKEWIKNKKESSVENI